MQLGAQGEAGRQRYASVRRNDNSVYDVGVSARYPGFGSIVSPEAGALWGERSGPAWNLYYAFEDVRSTRAERSFRTHLVALGATFRLGRL